MIDIENFIKTFKRQVDHILELDVIWGKSKKKSEKDTLVGAEWTYLINIAIYKTIRQYSIAHYPNKLHIIPEDGGRLPSDFSVENDKGEKILWIEHENDPTRAADNYKKLCGCKGGEKLLIIYEFGKNNKEQIKKRLKKIKKSNDETIFVLIGTADASKWFDIKI